MIKTSKILCARPLTKEEKALKQKIETEGCIDSFCKLYSKSWVPDPHFSEIPEYARPEDPCWLWIAGHDSDHYGRIKWRGTDLMVHRVAYQIKNGPLPEQDPTDPNRLEVDHKCEVHACFNPDHLQVVTRTLNQELIEIRQKFHMSRPKDERQKMAQIKFMREMYLRELRLNNQIEDLERSMAKRFHPSMHAEEPIDPKQQQIQQDIANKKTELDEINQRRKVYTPDEMTLAHIAKTSRDLINSLEDNGWEEKRQSGSHITFEKPGHPHHITIVHPKKDVGRAAEQTVKKEIACGNGVKK